MPPDVIEDLIASYPAAVVEVGDPGVVIDAETPFAELPPYEAPPEPLAGHVHEWGADVVAEAGLSEPSAG